MLNDQSIDFCLLIPCYNNQDGLVRSLRSVRYRSRRFLVLVVDDGSKVPVDQQVLEREAGADVPLFLIRHDRNQGITRALNTGLRWISEHKMASLVARLDCGDTCHPDRFNIQVDRMTGDSALLLTGTWCLFRDPLSESGYRYTSPMTQAGITTVMYQRNVFIHPTVMYRLDAVMKAGLYPENFHLVEDYALFWQLMQMGKVAVIGQFLVTCEINKGGISFVNKGKQLLGRWRVVKTFGAKPGLKIGGFSRLLALFILPKELILWLKQRKS